MGAYERAMIRAARPGILASQVSAMIEHEATKGCSPALLSAPVELEPAFEPVRSPRDLLQGGGICLGHSNPTPGDEDLIRLQLWISPEEDFDWKRSELFLKQVVDIRTRAGLEVIGNRKRVAIHFLCSRDDAPVLQAAFTAQFANATLTDTKEGDLSLGALRESAAIVFRDFYTPPPYSHLLTEPIELHVSPWEAFAANVSALPETSLGFCQILFQPVAPGHNWYRNAQVLFDLEHTIELMSTNPSASQIPQQGPSYALQQMSREVTTKAHNDRPFFATALRIGVACGQEDAERSLAALSIFARSFLHGGQGLRYVSDRVYSEFLPHVQLSRMFRLAQVYRPGFLLNSSELSGLVHVPAASIFQSRNIPLDVLKTLPAQGESLATGCLLGFSLRAGTREPVCIPDSLRARSVHMLGRHGLGKSTLIEQMVLLDISRGIGVAVLDPHGDLVERLLRRIPQSQIDRVIFFDPADPDYVPLWNPFRNRQIQDLGRLASDLVGAIKSFVEGWGDRLEKLLKYSFLGLLPLPDSSFQDVMDLLRKGSDEGERLRRRIVETTTNENIRKFWREDFPDFPKRDLDPPHNKLSKFLASGTCAEMLSQPESLIDFGRIMDERKVLLIDLSRLGSETGSILGSFILSIFHLTALTRRDLDPETRKFFGIYVDEAPKFTTGSMERLISESRKFGVGLAFAHQYLSQFDTTKRDALASVGTTVIFNVDTKDAAHLRKDLQDKVEVSDLITLNVGEAIARIGTEVVRFEVPEPPPVPKKHFRDEIVALSRRHYYRPVGQVRAAARGRDKRWEKPFSPLTDASEKEFEYDEL